MLTVPLADVMSRLQNANFDEFTKINISVLRNIMIEPVEPYLKYNAMLAGFEALVSFGDFDNVFKESVGGSPELLNKNTDCVLIFEYLEALSPMISKKFACYSQDEIDLEIKRIKDTVETILAGIRKQTDAMILWFGFEPPLYPMSGILDVHAENGQLSVVRDLNVFLRHILKKTPNAYLVDMELLLGRVGENEFYDNRYWHIGRAPYARKGISAIAFEAMKFIRATRGKNKKCLVLDCDNTLWGGIIGEDGLSGIKLSKTHPGSAYCEFQQEILNLHERGGILAVCSKNNEHDVWEVFENHPDMVLKRDHIAAARINWNDKVTNIRQISEELNIGIDSLVFVDDSEFEVNLVRKELPEVEVIHLPKGRAVEYRTMLLSCGLFDSLSSTAEDKSRGAMYKAEATRKKLKAQATDMEGYYLDLEMELDIRYATGFNIPRISQQTLKTNQFNLTTRRYNDEQVKFFVASPDFNVLTLQLSDKLGDSGIVGSAVLRYEEKNAVIDTLLLSCRALGRGVEHAFLNQILKLARKNGCEKVIGEYLKTGKNKLVENFYLENQFEEISDRGNSEKRLFRFDLSQSINLEPGYFKRINSEVDKEDNDER